MMVFFSLPENHPILNGLVQRGPITGKNGLDLAYVVENDAVDGLMAEPNRFNAEARRFNFESISLNDKPISINGEAWRVIVQARSINGEAIYLTAEALRLNTDTQRLKADDLGGGWVASRADN